VGGVMTLTSGGKSCKKTGNCHFKPMEEVPKQQDAPDYAYPDS